MTTDERELVSVVGCHPIRGAVWSPKSLEIEIAIALQHLGYSSGSSWLLGLLWRRDRSAAAVSGPIIWRLSGVSLSHFRAQPTERSSISGRRPARSRSATAPVRMTEVRSTKPSSGNSGNSGNPSHRHRAGMVRDLHVGPRASTGHFPPPWWIVRLHEVREAS